MEESSILTKLSGKIWQMKLKIILWGQFLPISKETILPSIPWQIYAQSVTTRFPENITLILTKLSGPPGAQPFSPGNYPPNYPLANSKYLWKICDNKAYGKHKSNFDQTFRITWSSACFPRKLSSQPSPGQFQMFMHNLWRGLWET